jgi:hypothetical protein
VQGVFDMTRVAIEKAKLEQVLEALERHGVAPKDWACKECVPFSDILKDGFQCKYHKAITVAKQALAQPVQEPVADAWMHKDGRLTDAKAKTAHAENFHGWRPMAFITSTTQPAQPAVQEPVGEVVIESMGVRGSDAMRVRMHFYKEIPPVGSKIYTTQPAAPVPLTDEQIDSAWLLNGGGLAANRYYDFARAIEAAHGITKGGTT